MQKLDYKKEYKELYQPKTTPSLITVPKISFIAVEGCGNPNEPDGEYQATVALLYALSYTIKMSKRAGNAPEGYFEYAVPPLEGLWWMENLEGVDYADKSKFCWVAMLRQPEFVTDEAFAWACGEVRRKKGLSPEKARLTAMEEGLCVQCMHLGPYDSEPETAARIEEFIAQNGLLSDLCVERRHHEIYLGDPRKTAPAKLKTVLRHPVRRR